MILFFLLVQAHFIIKHLILDYSTTKCKEKPLTLRRSSAKTQLLLFCYLSAPFSSEHPSFSQKIHILMLLGNKELSQRRCSLNIVALIDFKALNGLSAVNIKTQVITCLITSFYFIFSNFQASKANICSELKNIHRIHYVIFFNSSN